MYIMYSLVLWCLCDCTFFCCCVFRAVLWEFEIIFVMNFCVWSCSVFIIVDWWVFCASCCLLTVLFNVMLLAL